MPENGQITGPDLIADDVLARIRELNEELKTVITTLGQVEAAGRSAFNIEQLAQRVTQLEEATRKSNKTLSERERLEKALVRQQERVKQGLTQTNRELIRQRVITQEQNRTIKRQETANNSLVGAYRRLSAQLNIAKELYKDLAVEQGVNSTAARRQAQEVERLQGKVRQADQAVGDFQRNVGNYPTALRPAVTVIKQLVGAFGAFEVFRLGRRFVRDAIEIAREARGVEFAFERLGEEGEEAFQKTTRAVRGLISELDIKRSLVEFDNFNISLEQSAVLFEFLSIRAAQTGRSIEKLRDSLVEGLSKESRLRIDNLGISVLQLNEELEKTPNFVQAVANIAQTEIAEAGDILDEAANGAQRFDASFQNLELALGNVFTQFKGLKPVTDLIDLGVTNTKLWNEQLFAQGDILGFLSSVVRTTSIAGRVENERLLEEIELRKEVEKEIQDQIDAYVRLNATIGPLEEGQQNQEKQFSLYVDAVGEAVLTVGDLNDKIKELNDELLKQTTRSGAAEIQKQIELYEQQRDAILGIVEAEEKRKRTFEDFDLDSEGFITGTIQQLEKQRQEVAIGSLAWQDLGDQIELFQKKLQFLKDNAEFSLDKIIFIEDDLPIFEELDQILNADRIEAGMRTLADNLKLPMEELYEEFRRLYEQDFASFLQYSKDKIEATEAERDVRLEIAREIVQGISDIGSALFDAAQARAEEEVERQNEVYDSIIANKDATEEQIAIAEQKREENEKKLAKEREKRLRNEFLLTQAANVAQAFLSKSQAEIALLAQSRLLPPGVSEGYVAAIQTLINTQFAVSLATILAQTIPQFFKGKGLGDNYEGLATWGERGKEVRITEGGGVEVSPPTTTPTYVSRDDIILRNIGLFRREMKNPSGEVYRRVTKAWRNDTSSRREVIAPSVLDSAGIKRTIDLGIKRGFRGVEHKINIINRWDRPRFSKYG